MTRKSGDVKCYACRTWHKPFLRVQRLFVNPGDDADTPLEINICSGMCMVRLGGMFELELRREAQRARDTAESPPPTKEAPEMGKHRTVGKISAGDHVQHIAGWTGKVLDVEQEGYGRRFKVERDDIPGIQWWRETVFTRVKERATR